MTAYWELLRDPRWQRKRLEVMERAGFACENCGANDKTLNVHHGYYAKGRAPWDYESESLKCLCEECHERITALLAEAHQALGLLETWELQRVIGYARAVRWVGCRCNRDIPARGGDAITGVLNAIGASGEQVENLAYEHAEANGWVLRHRALHVFVDLSIVQERILGQYREKSEHAKTEEASAQ